MSTLAGKAIGPIGLGLMNLTWRPVSVPREQAFAAIKTALDAGYNFLNAGEFYNAPERPCENLDYLSEFFKKYPEYLDKAVVSVKGAIGPDFSPQSDPESLMASIDNIAKHLAPKTLDVFEPARVDANVPIEDIVTTLAKAVEAGKIKAISLSEVSAKTLEKACAVQKIDAVEIEFSMFTTEPRSNGMFKVAAENGVTVVCYSPFARGFLAGAFRGQTKYNGDDLRQHFDRFSPENFAANQRTSDLIYEFAERKGVRASQVALAWIMYHEKLFPGLQLIPIPGASSPERVKENIVDFSLTDDEFNELEQILASAEIKGGRANAVMIKHMDV
ncbi:hypothetical protein CANCADRAFT_145456 [Tortispora caseinolytica NRRL Y-17796]|uniref:NADP-dependent oxidoreductase domain-containing protein n=1 Tax=Tortispora caseinolytica NRRL Y-17796 TaxID=767744 RepID=A0A1E4T9F8_9ASCO|nr:hypothetical protein CANCADRAFT_145456 [Tortispora caseinolytica NRRL Y-17796]